MMEPTRLLLETTLATSAAIVLVLLLRTPWRRWFGPRALAWLWTLVPAALLAVLLPAPTVEISAEVDAAPLPAPVVATVAPSAQPLPVVTAPVIDAPQPTNPWLLIWLLGGAAMALRLGVEQARFRRRAQPLAPRSDGSFSAARTDIGPAVLGLWRSRVVVPSDFDLRYTPAQRALILAHERAHLRHGDLYANTFASLLRCLFWFNPLVHVACARLRFDQELAADADVLARHPRRTRIYADAMLRTELVAAGLPLGCHWQSAHPLKTRVLMLGRQRPRARGRVGAVLSMALGAATTVAAWAAQPPRVVVVPVPASTPMPMVATAPSAIAAPRLAVDDLPLAAVSRPAPAALTYAPVDAMPAAETSAPEPAPAPVLADPAPVPPLTAQRQAPERSPLFVPASPLLAVPPAAADRHSDGGEVLLRVTIDAEGHARDSAVERADDPLLAQRAIATLADWRFSPATLDGDAVPSQVLLPLAYTPPPTTHREPLRSHVPRYGGIVDLPSGARGKLY